MKIGIGNDHVGVELKEYIIKEFEGEGIEFVNYGTNSSDSVDYPDFGQAVGEAVARGEVDKGIVICGTGIGISIAANKVKGVRCALCNGIYASRMAREHNDANVLALGGRVIGVELAREIVKVFLETEFLGERHAKRVKKLNEI